MKTWQLLWALVRRAPWLYGLTFALQFPRRLIRLVPGLLIKALFDQLAGARAPGWNFWGLIALLLGVALARATLLVGTMAAERLPIQRSVTLLRTNLLRQILRQPGAVGLPLPVGDAANRLQEDPGSIAFTIAMLIYTAGVAVETLVALAIMGSIDAPLTLVAVLPVFAASWALQLAGGRVAHYRRQGRAAAGQVQAYLGDLFGAVQALQAAGTEQVATARLGALGAARRRAALREQLFAGGVLGLFSSGGASMATGAVLLLGGTALRAGSFSVGDFALFVYYLTLVEDFVSLLIGEVVRYRQAGVAYERLLPLLVGAPPHMLVQPIRWRGEFKRGQPPLAPPFPPGWGGEFKRGQPPLAPPFPPGWGGEFKRGQPPLAALLEARGLSYRYPSSTRGIAGVNLRIGRGQLVVITGRIGAGKTTLLRALLGLLPLDAGTLVWNGVTVENPTSFFGPPRSAYTPQVPTLFSTTLRENILLGLPPDAAALEQAVALAALAPDVTTLEAGLDTTIGPRGMKLSGGQVQRTAAARMLVRRPELLVVDDLSSALDVETEQVLWESIGYRLQVTGDSSTTTGAAATAPVTCLAVSHRHALLRRADLVLLLDDGRLVAEGRAEELLGSSALFRQLWQGADQ